MCIGECSVHVLFVYSFARSTPQPWTYIFCLSSMLSFFLSLFTERLLSDATVFFKTDSYMFIMHCACFAKPVLGDIPALVILAFRQSRHRRYLFLFLSFSSSSPLFFHCFLFIIIVTSFLNYFTLIKCHGHHFEGWKLRLLHNYQL